MEILVQIIEQHPLKERQYTDKSGNNRIIATRGFILSNGINTFYAEMNGDKARNISQLPTDVLYNADVQFRMRSYKTQKDETVWVNDIYLNNISQF